MNLKMEIIMASNPIKLSKREIEVCKTTISQQETIQTQRILV